VSAGPRERLTASETSIRGFRCNRWFPICSVCQASKWIVALAVEQFGPIGGRKHFLQRLGSLEVDVEAVILSLIYRPV
jgi:hypothetical protein